MGQHKTTNWHETSALIDSGLALDAVKRVHGSAQDLQDSGSAKVKSLFDVSHTQTETFTEDDSSSLAEVFLLLDQLATKLPKSDKKLKQRLEDLKTELSGEQDHFQAEREEKEQLENSLSTLLDILPAGVVLLDDNGVVTQCNPAAVDLLGEPLEGLPWFEVITRSFSPKHDDGHEVSLKDGRRVRIETRSMASGSGQLVLLSDLTETRLLQEQVSRAERLSSLGRMVASLAHQIRTPLSTAMLYAGHLCQDEINDSMRQDCAEKLLARLTHLEHQIRDMLIFAKGDARLAEQITMNDLFDSLRSAAEPVLAKADVQCEWPEDVPDKALTCNKEALVGACLNLINNSIEAGEQSARDGQKQNNKKPLVLKVATELLDQDSVTLSISDNGPGIPKSQKEKVFEPFYTTKSQGTGLGLAVVKAVVKAHRGGFELNSSSKGVEARINLPVQNIARRRQKAQRSKATS